MFDYMFYSKFSVGEKIVCIDNSDFQFQLSINKIYIVLDCSFPFLIINGNDNFTVFIHEDNFLSLNEFRKQKLNIINESIY